MNRVFTVRDYKLIDSEWKSFEQIARTRCSSEEEFQLVRKAYEFAEFAHRNVRRRSGQPHILHPLSVARIVVEELGLGCKSICAALLHDILESSDFTPDDISSMFGPKIAQLVEGLYKIKVVLDDDARKSISAVVSESIQAENFKRILLSLGDDARVVLIKLADRLHNCRTIEYLPELKRGRVLAETKYIFIPLAHRLGLFSIKSEMEDIWLRYKEPLEYDSISKKINRDFSEREKEIDEFIEPIRETLERSGCKFTVKKRIKSPYSIWNKMRTKRVGFEQIYDLYAIRIIYEPENESEEKDEAFRIYGLLSSLYTEKAERKRDWISSPKQNGYESLQGTFLSKEGGIWVEAQIRSKRMDEIAEKGIAAHWTYKNNGYVSELDTEMDRWLLKVQEVLKSRNLDAFEVLDLIHSDLSTGSITVFTPKGEQKSIEAGSTALDFAYSIHSEVGSRAIACKINGVLYPTDTLLKAGDKVEIITARLATPKIEWLEFLRTSLARARVIDWFRSEREQIASQGQELYRERLEAMGIEGGRDIFRLFQDCTQLNDSTELYYRIGLGIIGPEEFKKILGSSCSSADKEEFPVRLNIRGADRKGLLGELSRCISEAHDINIRKVQISSSNGQYDGFVDISVLDRKQLKDLVSNLKKIDGVTHVVRTDILV